MSGRLKAYRLSWAVAQRMPAPFRAAHSLLWLQLLRPEELIDLTVASYAEPDASGFAAEDHNLGGLLPWEEEAVAAAFGGSRTVLVAAAGSGREVISLARRGFAVTGFDVSPELVEAGRRNLVKAGVEAALHLAPACRVPAGLPVHDALFVGRGSYHHIPSAERRIGFLSACRRYLSPDAPILLGDFQTRTSTRVGRRWRHEAGDNVGSSFFHFFNEAEVRAELECAGFELLDYRPVKGTSLAHALGRAQ